VFGCDASRTRYEGQVRNSLTGYPAPGVRVEFAADAGTPAQPMAVEVETNGRGRFELDLGAGGGGPVRGTLTIHPDVAGEPPLQVHGVEMLPTRVPGELRFLGAFSVVRPHLSAVGLLVWHATGAPATQIQVAFRRTGGIVVYPEVYRSFTDTGGYFRIRSVPADSGEVVGDLYFILPPPHGTEVARGVRLQTHTTENLAVGIGAFAVGAQ
jgi:5-hydroxyisourate hydrolase-like protein (transthyretin family)